jgi:hypothetical protein
MDLYLSQRGLRSPLVFAQKNGCATAIEAGLLRHFD